MRRRRSNERHKKLNHGVDVRDGITAADAHNAFVGIDEHRQTWADTRDRGWNIRTARAFLHANQIPPQNQRNPK
jgi:hypothetical protein